ncbi:polysaccharide deacetylase family protein [Puniceicoccus vermicola]|uniref:Polysaccharide deacetylase family protein n=1 Tax=Puniceicoccus vermicola TaxID=388746 RepID=A0A7X1B1D9_9BACT|nr:polysaccharide deacetylase family protein [Puniceicoccus vermicola]MBC2603833.1 polysaccharide deacetylase family protein [Puniceicoccus vermicola]
MINWIGHIGATWRLGIVFSILTIFCHAEEATIIPVSTSPPGGLSPDKVPQMIVITFDDAVQEQVFGLLELIEGHQNPDGSAIPFTFFVSTNDSDYWLIHRLHAAGHEIAVHTMTHTTGLDTDFETWIHEMEGCRETLIRFAGIPREEIRGFRAPFLAHNGPMFEALAALDFAYNSSSLEAPGWETASSDASHFIWPYTLHDGLQHERWTETGSEESLPSILEIPMWRLKEGENYLGMDPGVSGESLDNVLRENFELRYNGTAPRWASGSTPRPGSMTGPREA